MSKTSKLIGQRIRNYRLQQRFSQEKLAELAGCHPTYIGQIERGEKNATIESIEKIASALNISLSELFEGIGSQRSDTNFPLQCYELLSTKSIADQERLFHLLAEIDQYKQSH